MRYLLLLAPLLMGVVVTPIQQGGEYVWKTLPAPVSLDPDGVPTEPPTASISIRDTSGTEYGCADVDPAVTYDVANPLMIPTTIPAPPQGSRVKVQAYAHTLVGCTGLVSPGSSEFGAVWFGPPGKSRLL